MRNICRKLKWKCLKITQEKINNMNQRNAYKKIKIINVQDLHHSTHKRKKQLTKTKLNSNFLQNILQEKPNCTEKI